MPVKRSQVLNNESSKAKIAVAIVTYNAAETLQICLDSVFSQTYHHIEIIVIDGSSTDGTIDILKKNSSKITYWESEKDQGIYFAMNKATQHLTGQWVYFMGADDALLPEFSDIIPQLTDPSAIYYANVFSDGAKRLGELTRYQFAKFGPYHQAIIYPKAVFDKYQFDTRYLISSDFALTLKLCGDKTFHFVYLDYTIANFNHLGISGNQIDWPFQSEKGRLIFKNFGLRIWLRYKIRKLKSRNNPRV